MTNANLKSRMRAVQNACWYAGHCAPWGEYREKHRAVGLVKLRFHLRKQTGWTKKEADLAIAEAITRFALVPAGPGRFDTHTVKLVGGPLAGFVYRPQFGDPLGLTVRAGETVLLDARFEEDAKAIEIGFSGKYIAVPGSANEWEWRAPR